MSIASVQSYVQSLLDQMTWPASMTNLPDLNCFITPPNPNVQSEIPTAYVWMQRGRESRDTTRLRGGTVPRSSVPGGPSGYKMVEHTIPIYLVWAMSSEDPDVDNLFPGMVWQIMDVLRGGAYGAGGSISADPVLLTDPWTAQPSWLIDLGEEIQYDTDLRTLAAERLLRFDALIECSVSELIGA